MCRHDRRSLNVTAALDRLDTHMRFDMSTKQLKTAITSIQTLAKKMPSENRGVSEPTMALLRCDDGYRMISCFEWFTASVLVDDVNCLTESGGDALTAWDGSGAIESESCIGLVDASKMASVLSKVKDDRCTIEYEQGGATLSMMFGKTRSYTFDVSDPRRIAANFGRRVATTTIAEIEFEKLERIATIATMFGTIIRSQVAHPEFENLCLSSEDVPGSPDAKQRLRASVSIIDVGLSIVEDFDIECDAPFTALFPKETATALKGFINQFKDVETVSIGCSQDKSNKDMSLAARSFRMSSDVFDVSLTCRSAMFPFPTITGIVKRLSTPSALVKVSAADFKKVIARLSVIADDDAATTVIVTDAGTLRFNQHRHRLRTRFTGNESMTSEIISFDNSNVEYKSTVASELLIKASKLITSQDVYIGFTSMPGSSFLSLGSDMSAFDGTLIGLSPIRI